MTVSAEDVRALLTSDARDAHLILEEGVVSVVSADAVADDPSALVVATAREITDALGHADLPGDDRLRILAAQLDSRVATLGG
ncbi:hypothetical protein ACQ7HM_10945 [Williamsia sp. MIQD14]|uniref:hypothetical protein n=1 Tax=Williamsia sp. MIQD14 TaxID=3425703 RepID=UPI003DA0C080